MKNVPVVSLVPSSYYVNWPAVGYYYEIDGRFKLCVAVNHATGWATFLGPECENEYYSLDDLGLLTEYTLEASSEVAAA